MGKENDAGLQCDESPLRARRKKWRPRRPLARRGAVYNPSSTFFLEKSMVVEAASMAENNTYGLEYSERAQAPLCDFDRPESKLPCADSVRWKSPPLEEEKSIEGPPN